MFVPLKRRRGMSRCPRILNVLARKSSPSDATCSSQRERRNGKCETAGVARQCEIRRYEMRTDIGERRSGYQMRSLETWTVPGIKGRNIGRALGKYIYAFTLKNIKRVQRWNIFSKRFKADFYVACKNFIIKAVFVKCFIHTCAFADLFNFKKIALNMKN